MIQRKTTVSQIEVTEAGVVQVRLNKLLVDEGTEIMRQYHRFVLHPATDFDEIVNAVQVNLVQMGEEPMTAEDVERVRKFVVLARS